MSAREPKSSQHHDRYLPIPTTPRRRNDFFDDELERFGKGLMIGLRVYMEAREDAERMREDLSEIIRSRLKPLNPSKNRLCEALRFLHRALGTSLQKESMAPDDIDPEHLIEQWRENFFVAERICARTKRKRDCDDPHILELGPHPRKIARFN